ncbi:Lrp/AsnC ligand binding domain-containing protein [Paenibacillus sp. UNC217MF]
MVRQAVVACEPVLECHHVAGQYDYLVKGTRCRYAGIGIFHISYAE